MPRKSVFAILSGLMVALVVLAACAQATPTATPRPATPTAVPTVPTGVTPTAVPPTPTLSAAQTTFVSAKQKFETETVPAALKEGVVTWYTCHQTLEAQDQIKVFNTLYPGIKVEYVYDNPGPLVTRIKAEAAAGKIIADVYNCGGTSAYILGWDGFAEEYAPPTALDPSLKWDGGMTPTSAGPFWTTWGYRIGSALINTDLVSKDHYPVSWSDFVKDPFWTTKTLGMANPFAPGFLGQFHYIWYHDPTLGEGFVKALSDKKPTVIKTGGQDIIARGEIASYIGGAAETPYVAPWKGAPIQSFYPKEGVYGVAWVSDIVKNAPHPNAAKVFTDAWLRPEMQEALARWGRIPIRSGTKLAIPEMAIETKPLNGWGTPEVEKEISGYYAALDQKGFYK